MRYDEAEQTLFDWERSGWCRFLPFEGRVLWDVFCDVTTFGIDGDLETIVDWHLCTRYPPMDLDIAALLDAPLRHRRFRGDQRRLERMFARLGHAYPRTTREIVDVGVALGLYLYTQDEYGTRWRVPPALPLPCEVLPMTPRQRADEDARRWRLAASLPGARVVELLSDDGQPRQLVTSIACLASSLGEDPESVRQGLVYLCESDTWRWWERPAIRLFVGAGGGRLTAASPERIHDDDPCVLIPNWRELRRRDPELAVSGEDR